MLSKNIFILPTITLTNNDFIFPKIPTPKKTIHEEISELVSESIPHKQDREKCIGKINELISEIIELTDKY